MNGNKTLRDFSVMYNRFNDKKSIKEIYNEMNYRAELTCTGNEFYCKNGVRVEQIDATTRYGTKAVYYKVTTKVGWSIPFINKILALDKGEGKGAGVTSGNWTISGETRIITSNE